MDRENWKKYKKELPGFGSKLGLEKGRRKKQETIKEQKALFLRIYEAIGNWNITDACKVAGISRGLPTQWKKDDEQFANGLIIIEESKKDLYETKLIEKVRKNDVAAIIFANKTKNIDRGYGERQKIETTVRSTLSREQIDAIVKVDEIGTAAEMMERQKRKKQEEIEKTIH